MKNVGAVVLAFACLFAAATPGAAIPPGTGEGSGSGSAASGKGRQAAGRDSPPTQASGGQAGEPGFSPVGTPRTLSLSLDEALDLAEGLAPQLGEFRALVARATAGLESAKSGRMPTLGATARYSRWNNVPEWTILQDGVPTVIYPNLPNNVLLELDGSLPLYTGGRVEADVAAAERNIAATNLDVETETANIRLRVTTAYWELALAIEQERVLAASIESFEAFLVDARNREEIGLAARNEVLAVQTERDRAELRRLLAASNVEVLQDRLAALLDLPVGSRVEPTDELDLTPATGDPVSLVTAAFEQRPERKAARERLAAAEARLEGAKALGKPVIAAGGALRYSNPDRRVVPPEYDFRFSWDASVGVTYDIFDGGKRDAAAAAAVAEIDQARYRLQELERSIRTEVVESYQRFDAARAGVDVAEQGIRSAEENTRVTIDLYEEGLVPFSDRLDAQTAELLSRLELTEALAKVELARAALDRAVGR